MVNHLKKQRKKLVKILKRTNQRVKILEMLLLQNMNLKIQRNLLQIKMFLLPQLRESTIMLHLKARHPERTPRVKINQWEVKNLTENLALLKKLQIKQTKRILIQSQRSNQTQDHHQHQIQSLKIIRLLRMVLLQEPPVQNLNQRIKQQPLIKVPNIKEMSTQQPTRIVRRNEANNILKIG